MKKHATTLVLLLLAVVLGVWLWIDRDKVSEGERKRRESSAFVAWRKDEVSRVEIAHPGETVVLERDAKSDSPWRMTSPRAERADQAAVERLLTTMEFASVVRKPTESAALGLEQPRASGAVTMGGLVMRFVLGAPSPRPEGSSYFRLDGEPPIVVSKELADTLLQGADAYRDRAVVPYLSLDLSHFAVSHPGGGFTLDRLDERTFKVAERGVVASREDLDSVWSALAEMRAESFPKEADVERLTASPRLTITMKPKDGRPEAVLVAGDACPGHPDDVVVLRKEPTRVAACAPKGAIEALLKATPAALVDRHPFSFRADEIEELRLEPVPSGPSAIEIARKGTGWHERVPADRDLSADEADAASELVSRIAKSEAEDVAEGDHAPFEAIARATVRSGPREEIVEVGRTRSDGRVPLRRVRDDARLVMSRLSGGRLVPRSVTLAPRALLGETRRVTRVLLACGVRQELVDEGSGLKLVEPKGYETDGSILQLVDALTRGRVDEWVADADDGSFGLSSDACRVVLSFADGNAPATIRFGAEAEGGVFGTVEGKGPVFLVGKSVRDLAKKIYVSRAAPSAIVPGLFADDVLRLGPPDLGKVELELGTGPKKVRCGPLDEREMRPCVVPGVNAVFAISKARLSAVAAPVAPDGGPR